MKHGSVKRFVASLFSVAIAVTSAFAVAGTSTTSDAPKESCAIGYVTGIGGSAQSFREYQSSDNKYRYLADNPIQCQVSEEGRTSGCVGVVSLRNERVSVYDDSGDTTMSVVTRVELERGTYPVIIVVRKQDVRCEE
ncbi:hypothetical protein LMG28688_01170 [Paraburkholderia caffeinitolerans]|uniref:Lipoprotein n=1 Tax=Paraburkholderia caffeinitolerans TaxID=1723730 RepID=A0A6J5FMZ6_9BURK|nr:hypothetical protein [Paraburkholderia caffeinitolerans]CAB3781036.1 hypothetical protein LMG28688_01170 [Paraburkholderia caffeinitolerans]